MSTDEIRPAGTRASTRVRTTTPAILKVVSHVGLVAASSLGVELNPCARPTKCRIVPVVTPDVCDTQLAVLQNFVQTHSSPLINGTSAPQSH